MKKYIYLILSILTLSIGNSCSDREVYLNPATLDPPENVDTEAKLQMFLNSAYIGMGSSSAYGTNLMIFGDLLGDKAFSSNSNPQFVTTSNLNYSAITNDFGFYGRMYDIIMNCNIVLNNTKVENSPNVVRIKAEANIIRGYAYFILVSYYSPAPTSGINQEYGVPIVLGDYDVNIQPARATVAEVYSQIIDDLEAGLQNVQDSPITPENTPEKVIFSKTAAKLLLTKVYLTRRASGDAQLALQYATDIVNNSPSNFAPVEKASYSNYFVGTNDQLYENHNETIWELDMNANTNNLTGVGANVSLPGYYYRLGERKSLMFRRDFYDSFPTTDVRRGSASTGLLATIATPNADSPMGVWTNKYPRFTNGGNFVRNIKVLRFADAQLSRIEALHLTGQDVTALLELNAFSLSRGGVTYTGTDILTDILTERSKEFYGEGQRFLDLKRYNLPIIKNTNCVNNCNVPANDKLFVLPISQDVLNYNINLRQYPGY